MAANCQQGDDGGGNGELDLPNGVAATPSAVYVADTDNHRISKYTTEGAFVFARGLDVNTAAGAGTELCITTCQPGDPGGAGGEFNFPLGVAAGPGDTVYVADTSNQRIQQLDALGSFIRAWGKDVVTGAPTGFEVCTTVGSCKTGVVGGLGGELSSPASVSADSAGDVYAADLNNARIQQFSPTGELRPDLGQGRARRWVHGGRGLHGRGELQDR